MNHGTSIYEIFTRHVLKFYCEKLQLEGRVRSIMLSRGGRMDNCMKR